MTTPIGGIVNNLLGGITGTLSGTNSLQSSIDQLTQSVNRLSTQMGMGGNLNMNATPGQPGNYTGTLRFPRPQNPFQPPGQQGPAGNVSPPLPFGRIGAGFIGSSGMRAAFAGYGQQQMPFQIGLNAYASMSMMGMSNAGMPTFGSNFASLANQPGMPLTGSSMDYLQMMQSLSFLGGAPRYMSTALGRAGFGGAAAFGMTNPALSGAMSANLAQQIYNPMLSMRMRLMGYSMTPRVMGSGMPQSIGNIAASLIQGWYGTNKVAPSQLYKTLSMGGKGFINLQSLGLNPQQMAPLLEGFNQLFNAGYSPQQASNLFSAAASNNPNVSRPAQARLAQLHVTSVTSDIQKLKNNQAQVTQRSVNTAAGFDAALTTSTDLLQRFNAGLNSVLTTLHLNGALGAGGGLFGTLAGTNHGNALLGLGSTALLARALFGGGAARGGTAAAGGMLARLGLAGAAGLSGALGAGAAIWGVNNIHVGNKTLWQAGNPVAGHQTGWNSWSGLGHNINNWLSDLFGGPNSFPMPRGTGGGASAPVPTSTQSGKTNLISNVSSQAAEAVGAAKRELGVPYLWGGSSPAMGGFDCSGLVQWAYKQAGVNLPRTSQQQWASLKRKSVPLSQVQEGDLVFMGGADGTANNPGHVGMMINNRQLIEAPTAGQDVKIIGFDPKAWSHAARPTGRGSLGISNALPGNNSGASTLGLYGNAGAGMGLGNYGSSNEVDLISSTGGFLGSGVAFSAGGLGGISTTASSPASKTGNRGPAGNGSRAISAERAYAMQLLKARGWSGQFGALNSIIMAESGWRWNATNPQSGAYGIPQALPGSKMSSAGGDWRTNPDTQLRWMIDTYIPQRYGTPQNAWNFHQRMGWYGGGGLSTSPGIRIVGDRGPEAQIDTGNGTLTINNAQTMSLLKAISNPQQSPWKNLSNQNNSGGQTINPGISTGAKVNVTFGQGSICVQVSSTTDAQTAGQTIAKQIVNSIQNEQLWSAVAKGMKN